MSARPRLESLECRFALSTTGAVNLAFADVDGDGTEERITAFGAGGGPIVRVQNAQSGADELAFFAYEPSFRGGVEVTAADLNGDGRAEIITGAGLGGGPVVRIFDSQTGEPQASFFAYEPTFTGGVSVATADLDADGRAEIICGTGPGGGPLVRAVDGQNFQVRAEFFAYDSAFRDGVGVSAGDVDGDGRAEIITGAAVGGASHVQVFDSLGIARASYFAFDPTERFGVRVHAADIDADGQAEILTTPGAGGAGRLRVWSGLQVQLSYDLPLYDGDRGGAELAVMSGGLVVSTRPTSDFSGDYQTIDLTPPVSPPPSPPTIPPPSIIPPTVPPPPTIPPTVPPPPSTVPPPPSTVPPPPPTVTILDEGTFDSDGGFFYRPPNLRADGKYPLVVVYDPGAMANATPYRTIWEPIARQQEFIVFYSTYYRNQHPDISIDDDFYDEPAFLNAKTHIETMLANEPIDPTRIMLTGLSGGGSFAHALNFVFPGMFSVVLANSAMIWGTTEPPEGQNGPLIHETVAANLDDYIETFRASESRQIVILLASPGDFRYEEMQNDKNLYMSLGWNVRYQEFSGGHQLAPAATYVDAINWLSVQSAWTSD